MLPSLRWHPHVCIVPYDVLLLQVLRFEFHRSIPVNHKASSLSKLYIRPKWISADPLGDSESERGRWIFYFVDSDMRLGEESTNTSV